MAGIENAGHRLYDPDAPEPLIVLVSCPVPQYVEGRVPRLSGKLKIKILPDSLASRSYQQFEADEAFSCNYELNPDFRERLEWSGLKVSGVSENGSVRIVELPGRRFFLATGFQPQLSSEPSHPHPLIVAYVEAALE